MKTITLLNKITKLFLVLVVCFTFSAVKAQNILIIYDDSPSNSNTVSLTNSLNTAGFTVTYSAVSEFNWNNSNPSLCGYEAVIHLNGTTYSQEMPAAGQLALVDYVQNHNGLYVGFEWNAYQVNNGQYQNMIDLVLFERVQGSEPGPFAVTTVPAESGHPVLAGVTSPFNLTAGINQGPLRTFAAEPSTTLMTIGADPAVAIRDFGTGHVLGFSNAGNYGGYPTLSNVELQKLIVNFISAYYTPYSALVGTDTQVACDTYTWLDGNTYNVDNNVATFSYTNGIGCDSIITLDLTINNSEATSDVITSCDSIVWIDGNTYNADNNVAMLTLTNATGCDSVVTLDLTIVPLDLTTTLNDFTITANEVGVTYQWINCSDNLPIAGETSQSFTAIANGDYAVVLTGPDCSDTSDCVTIAGVGINEIEGLNVSIYPNPNNGEFYISTIEKDVKVTVYTADGKVVLNTLKITKTNQSIDLGNIESGIYFVEISNEINQKTVRLIIE